MKLIKILLIFSLIAVIAIVSINVYVHTNSKPFIYKNEYNGPSCYTAIVLGAKVSKSGNLSYILQDRMDGAIQLYRNGKIKRFLLSGDHGQADYDEVNSMKAYLIGKGIHTNDIFLDHAGFDTYNTMVRAKEIFNVTDAIIVTQEFHLSRSVYIARQKGLIAYGFCADKRAYGSINRLIIREFIANVKAFIEVAIDKQPRFSGSPIPITGNSTLSYD